MTTARTFTAELKVILRHSLTYSVSNMLSRMVSFVMIPVYTRFLSPADYGILELITITLNLMSVVLAAGVTEAVSRFYFDYDDQKKRNIVISTGLIGFIAIATVSFSVFAPLSGFLADFILGSSSMGSFFLIAFGYLAMSLILQVIFAYFRVVHRSITLTLSSLAGLLVSLLLNIYFVVYLEIGVQGILLATLITHTLQVIVLIPMTVKKVGLHFDLELIKRMFRFGFPIIFSQLAHQVVTASDRFFIKVFCTLADTGLYSLGYKLGALVITFVATPFDMIWTPRRFEHFGKEDYEQVFSRMFTYFIFVVTLVGLYISILTEDLLKLAVTEPFWEAAKVVPIITLTYVLYSFYYHFTIGILMKKKTTLYAMINIATGALNLTLNYFLIKAYFVWGAAVSTLICYIFKPAVTYYFSNRLHPIYMETKRLSMIIVCAIIVYGICALIDTGNPYYNIVLKSLCGTLYVLSLYVFRFFSDDEIRKAKELVKKALNRILSRRIEP